MYFLEPRNILTALFKSYSELFNDSSLEMIGEFSLFLLPRLHGVKLG